MVVDGGAGFLEATAAQSGAAARREEKNRLEWRLSYRSVVWELEREYCTANKK